MLLLVWEYAVRAGANEEFESLYRPDGAWVELFHGSPGFVSTTLMKDTRNPQRYMVADRWTSLEAYELFRREHGPEYLVLDERGRRLYGAEHEVGRFSFLD